ncbi:MAG: UDP-N-acetylmuramoyl-L-alanine--D-glutamate ligase, partial [Streptosporangiales bacterium]|nr:UDP-N-acetylmuramoyl-L-alanine--D-glutamate ligase [Streptosporangiales bacterium]
MALVSSGVELYGRRVAVAGIGVSGLAAARVLLERGAVVTVLDAADGEAQRRNAAGLEDAGASVRLGAAAEPPVDADLVVTSPGLSPAAPLLAPVLARGVPVIGEVELAWWLRGEHAAPWLAVTGTNGKTTVVHMLASMLDAAGARTVATGNVGWPAVSAVTADPPYDVLAVELSSFQLHWAPSVRPFASVVLNLAPDHLDWHGSYQAYAADKARIWAPGSRVVANADDTA